MSQKNEPRHCSNSSPLLAVANVRKQSLLDAILSKPNSEFGSNNCFGLDYNYRNNPRYNPNKILAPTHQGETRAPCLLRSPQELRLLPRFAVSVREDDAHKEVVRCGGGGGEDDEDDEDDEASEFGISEGDMSCAPWSCRSCHTDDITKLQTGADSSLVCSSCGAVSSTVQMVEQVRSKNCPEGEDATQVADAPSCSAEHAYYEAWSKGPESAEKRKRRETANSGGTRPAQALLKRRNMLLAQHIVERKALRSMVAFYEGEARAACAKRGIIVRLEVMFKTVRIDQEWLQKYIRLEAIRIYATSLRHEDACGKNGCMLKLSQRQNTLYGYCVTEYTIERLIMAEGYKGPHEMRTIGDVSSGSGTVHELRVQLKEVKALQHRFSAAQQRQQVTSAINIISEWDWSKAEKQCRDTDPAPMALRLPPSVANVPEEYGRTTPVDPGDVTIKLRDRVQQTARIVQMRGDVRNAALLHLSVPQIIRFLRDAEGWDVDLLSCLLLAATAIKMNEEDETLKLRTNLLARQEISPTTFVEFAARLVIIMGDFAPNTDVDDIYAC